jgi:hypothetical protein
VNKNKSRNITPGEVLKTNFGEMPKLVQARLFLLSVWAYYIRGNSVRAWRRYWRLWLKKGGA